METFWLDFSKGVNSIIDKAVSADGFATALDNVDIRSGMPRPVLGPDYFAPVTVSSAVQIFVYRGRIIETPAPTDHRKYSYRSYVARMEDGSERIYWTEYGSSPQKMVDGVQAPLGTMVPAVPPYVTTGDSLIPKTVTLVNGAENSGTLPDSESSYRVSAVIDDYIMPPSAPAIIKPKANGSVTINWAGVANAKGYIVWGRKYGLEEIIKRVGASDILTFVDDGRGESEGDFAQNYENKTPVTYAYSYVRQVGNMLDEGGLSYPSQIVTKGNIHRVTRNLRLDGFFAMPGSMRYYDDSAYPGGAQVTGDHLIEIDATSTAIVVDSTQSYVGGFTHFTCSAAHNLVTGDTVTFTDPTNDSLTYLEKYTTVYVSATVFAINNIAAISSTVTLPMNFVRNHARVAWTPTGATDPVEGDTIYLKAVMADGTTKFEGTYAVKAGASAGECYINEYVANKIATRYNGGGEWDGSTDHSKHTVSLEMRWLPGNAFIKYWRLYRTGDAGSYLMVRELDVSTMYYEDALPPQALGDPPEGYYTESLTQVLFEPPPLGMDGLTEHYGMMFGIDGNCVRWTPVNQPDAWPEAFKTPPFQHRPVAIRSFNQALVILCQDKPYRLDGTNPATLALTSTVSKDGCVAPYTVQIVNDKLVYLASRGIVAFDGFNTVCITSLRLQPTFFFGGSAFVDNESHKWFWQRTMDTHAYAKLAAPEISGFAQNASALRYTMPIDLPIREIGSFVFNGRYYMYWIRNEYMVGSHSHAYFQAHSTICIDFEAPGTPITTLGLQPIWVHVDELQKPYALVNYVPPD